MSVRNGFICLAAGWVALMLVASPGVAHEIKVGTLTIQHPWAREEVSGKVAHGFMKITNHGDTADRLVAVTSEISSKTILHDDGASQSSSEIAELKDGIVIPAGQTVALRPQSLCIMFAKASGMPMSGTVFSGTLSFEKAGQVKVEFEMDESQAQ